MPHVPRRATQATSGSPPEFYARDPIPVSRPKPAEAGAGAEPADRPTVRVGLGRISPHGYSPDIKQVVRAMFGKEPEFDEHTRELVFGKRGG